MSTPTRSGPLVAAALLVFAAAAIPGSIWTGAVAPDDPRNLALGVWILRGALALLAAFLLLAPRFERSGAPGAPPADAARSAAAGAGLTASFVFVLAAAVRAHRLDAPLWFDEIWMIIDCVRHPLPESFRTFASDNNHPLYSFLATACARVFGETAWAIRLPAALFGAASVAAVHVFARRRLGGRAAVAASLLLALSFHHVGFSQNARGYTGLLLFTVVSSHGLLCALETGRRSAWVLQGIALALCVTLHLTGVFTAFGHLAVLAWAAFRRPAWLHPGGLRAAALGFVLATLTALAAYALVLPQVVHFFLLRPDRAAVDAAWTDPWWFVAETARSLGFGVGPGLAILGVAAVVAVAGLVAAGRRSLPLVLLTVVPAGVTAAVMLAMGRNLWPRLFFASSGFGALVATVGALAFVRAVLGRVPAGKAPRIAARAETAVVVLLVLCAAATLPRAFALPKQDFEAPQRYLAAERRAGEPVYAVGMASYVYREYLEAGYVDVRTDRDAGRLTENSGRAWAVYTFPVFVESRLPSAWAVLQRDYREVARFRGGMGGGDVVVLRKGD